MAFVVGLMQAALQKREWSADGSSGGRSEPIALLGVLVLAAVILPSCGGNGTNASNNVSTITISPNAATVALNGQTDFSATVTLTNSTITTNTAVTWQVNGADGGNSATGTIVPSTTDVNVGVYTAPATAPTTNINITAIITQSASSTSTATSTITSNVATVTIGAGTGLALTTTQATVPAGGTYQFTAEINNVVTSDVTWSVSSANGGNIGSIASNGVFTAPPVPPPGGAVTITATEVGSSPAITATATAIIVYSDLSLQGPFAFSYTGNNSSGFIAVAGHFDADGAGTITSGVEDINSFGNHLVTRVSVLSGSTYRVGSDGRTTAVLVTSDGTQTWELVLTSSSHALMTRFDTSTTGSGTIDQQSLDALADVNGEVSGAYVLEAAGGDSSFNPMGIAGRFTANGAGGIPQTASIVDVNDNGSVKTSDTTLNGSYSFAGIDAGTGRGTLTLTSTNLGSLTFVFYAIGASNGVATQMHILETDSTNYLAGDVYASAAGPFAASSLAAGNYAFTAGGNFYIAGASAGAYGTGGVFTSDGNGNISGGVLDSNDGGTVTANTTVNSCPYTVDPTTGRIAITILTGSGACAAGSGSPEFAVYQTAQNTAVMLELDASAVASGTAYAQAPSVTSLSGNFAVALTGQGIFSNAPGSYQFDATGHMVLEVTGVSSGDLDINIFGSVYSSDPLSSTGSATSPSSLTAPGTNGRGTATIVATDPPATYSLAYYVVNANTTLLLGLDKNRIETGIVALQY